MRLVRIGALNVPTLFFNGQIKTAFDRWLDNCAAKGIIRKPAALTLPSSAVPSGWSVVDYD